MKLTISENSFDPTQTHYFDFGHYYLGKLLEKINDQSLDRQIHLFLEKFEIPEISFLTLQNKIKSGQIALSEQHLKPGTVQD